MKITRVSTEITSAPKKHAIRDAIQLLDRDGHCKVRIETDGGIVGQSDIYSVGSPARPQSSRRSSTNSWDRRSSARIRT